MRPGRLSRASPEVHVLERPSARLEPSQADSEIGDGVPNGVVGRLPRCRGRCTPSVDGHVEAARREDATASSSARSSTSTTSPSGPRRGPRASRRDELPALDDHDCVADLLRLLEEVAREEDVQPNSVPMRRMSASTPSADRVEAVGRLVEEDELGIVGDRCGKLDALALARGIVADRTEALLAELDEPQRLVRPRDGRAAGQAGASRQGGARNRSRTAPQADRGARARSRCAIAARCPAVAGSLPSRSAHRCRAGGDRGASEIRRFAGAVRAEQAGDPGADVGIEARERDRAAVTLHDRARGDTVVRLCSTSIKSGA